MLLRGLPSDSALSRAVLGESWTTETSLLALIADRLGIIATGGKYGLRAVPDPFPRPKPPMAATTATDSATIAAFFSGGGSA